MGEPEDYPRLIARVRDFACAVLPAGSVVAVVSRGDDALLKLGALRASHFPRTLDGCYTGSHPANGEDAIAHLTRARYDGAQFLLFPRPALWWLDHYTELRRYLDEHCPPPFVADEEAARIYDLRGIGAGGVNVPWEEAARSLQAYALEPKRAQDLDRLLAQLLRLRMSVGRDGDAFESFQQLGLHVLPVHYYSPVPDTRALPDSLWSGDPEPLAGIDWNETAQLDLMRRAFPALRAECDALPRDLYEGNGMFEGRDALVYYCMIRHFRPRRIIEVGAGSSSRVAARAALVNGNTELVCIEPYPSAPLRAGFGGLTRLIARPVQEVPVDEFERLETGDILFIDSTHVARIGSDVNHLLFEVLPRLRPGVIVHVHDIFLPREYPMRWVKQKQFFWNEQYLLRAFLMFNTEFEVLLSNALLSVKHPGVVRETFPSTDPNEGASFWMRRKP